MGYTEMTVLYNGCLEGDSQVFDHSDKLYEWKFGNALAAAQRFAFDNSDATVEIYLLEHSHEFGIDCECIQYVTDHNPYWKQKGKKSEQVG